MDRATGSGAAGTADAQAGRPALVIDATTLQRRREGNPVGLFRVEAGLVDGCLAQAAARTALFAFDRRAGRMVGVQAAAIAERMGAPARPRAAPRRGWLRGIGRAVERTLRHALRRIIGEAVRALRSRAAAPPPAVRPGDAALCLGETWSVHDLAILRDWVKRERLRLVAVLYDLTPVLFPQWFADRELPGRFARYLELLRADADLVVCISEATRRDFERWSAARGGARGAVTTVPMGNDRPAEPPAAAPALAAGLRPGGFVLAVSTFQVRKNYELLYALWRRFRERDVAGLPVLVIAGRPGWLVGDLLTLIAKDPLTAGHIVICDDPDDATLAWLYANCRFTLYPSLYEGWGLPIAESFAYGKACIASDTSSMPEVGQGLAIHLDPLDFMAWQREVEALIADPQRLAAMEARIRAEFRPHGWAEAAAALIAAVDALAPAE